MIYDAAIIGTGPAGLSAALNLKIREKNFIWLGSAELSAKVRRAERVRNYPGLPELTGAALNEAFLRQVREMELTITEGVVNSILRVGEHYALMAGREFYEAKAVLLATGSTQVSTLRGEEALLGRGVSYCATCDGSLYRGRRIAVIIASPRFEHEVSYLAGLASQVLLFPTYRDCGIALPNVERLTSAPVAVEGEGRVAGLRCADGSIQQVDGVFCLREAVALGALLPGLGTEAGHIRVDRNMATDLPGVFAAGDCTGRPYQYAKSVGEGNVAAHSILEYLARLQ